jgi:hypothetical protein
LPCAARGGLRRRHLGDWFAGLAKGTVAISIAQVFRLRERFQV